MDFSPAKRCRGRVSLPLGHTRLGARKSAKPARKDFMGNLVRITNTSGSPARGMFSYGRSSVVGSQSGQGQGAVAIHKAVKAGDLGSVLALHSHPKPGLILGQGSSGAVNRSKNERVRRVEREHRLLRSSAQNTDTNTINRKNDMYSVKELGLKEMNDCKHSRAQRPQQVRNISFAYSMQQLEIVSVNCESSQPYEKFHSHPRQGIVLNNDREQTDLQDIFGDHTLQDVFTHHYEDDRLSTYSKQ